ncbi:MAG: LysR family transcriptional regulator [Oscillibacter sp.]|nr:LysR family transcriptional regulator [Oscillibacter sp.]
MTLTQMSYLMEIYKCGSMNKAAQNLFISQSALSSTIRELENELGVVIFYRSNRGTALTDEGRELLAQVTPIVEQSRKLQRYYSRRSAPEKVKLSISAQRYPFCARAFVEFLHEREDPFIEASLKETEMSSVIEDVARQESDLGILFLSDMTEPYIRRTLGARNLEFYQLVKIRPHVFLRKGHPLAGQPALHIQQLKDYPYVVFTRRDNNFNYAEEAVVGTGAEFNRVVYVNDRATAYNIMAHTDCVSTGSGVLPDGYGDERIMALPLADPVDDMRLGYIKIRGIPMSDLGCRFVALLEQTMAETQV